MDIVCVVFLLFVCVWACDNVPLSVRALLFISFFIMNKIPTGPLLFQPPTIYGFIWLFPFCADFHLGGRASSPLGSLRTWEWGAERDHLRLFEALLREACSCPFSEVWTPWGRARSEQGRVCPISGWWWFTLPWQDSQPLLRSGGEVGVGPPCRFFSWFSTQLSTCTFPSSSSLLLSYNSSWNF